MNKVCIAPENCTCVLGWTGKDCMTGAYAYCHDVTTLRGYIMQFDLCCVLTNRSAYIYCNSQNLAKRKALPK